MEKQKILEKYFSEHSLNEKTKKQLTDKFNKQAKEDDNIPYYVAETYFRRVLNSNEKDKDGKDISIRIKDCF